MKRNKDILNFLYSKKEEDKLFIFNTPELKEIDNEITIADEKITKFINSKIHPKCRNKLKNLISEYTDLIYDYDDEQNELFYREGFADGMKMILISLFLI